MRVEQMKEQIEQFKRTNGNESFTQKEMIMYLVTKVDAIEEKITDGAGKIAANRAGLKWIYVLGTVLVAFFLILLRTKGVL